MPPRKSASTTLNIDGVGPVLFERSARAKRLIISLKPFKGVRVAVPKGVSFEKAQQFVKAKSDWIVRTSKKMEQVEAKKASMADQLQSLDKLQAKTMLIERTIELAKEHGFAVNTVTVRNQKTKWGSCSSKNNISLNIQLALLPTELMDYVILHELVHIIVKNHSPAFWRELNKYVPNAKAVDAQMRAFTLAE